MPWRTSSFLGSSNPSPGNERDIGLPASADARDLRLSLHAESRDRPRSNTSVLYPSSWQAVSSNGPLRATDLGVSCDALSVEVRCDRVCFREREVESDAAILSLYALLLNGFAPLDTVLIWRSAFRRHLVKVTGVAGDSGAVAGRTDPPRFFEPADSRLGVLGEEYLP